jgi:ABC-2 type transport system permease protein
VALAAIRLNIKKKGFWIVAVIATLPYLFVAIQLFIQSSLAGKIPNILSNASVGQKYSSQFFQASGWGLWLFIIALMVGSGSIAADNQANALLVYLSKPLSKGDYLLGKWMGIFVMIFAVAVTPALMLYIYCLLSYSSEGFLKEEPWLIFRMLGAAAVPAAVHASLLVGFSAWSKTPRMAGAIYAGFYFISLIASMMAWGIQYRGDFSRGVLVRHLSVPSLIQGLQQNIYGVDNRQLGSRRRFIKPKRQIDAPADSRESGMVDIPVPAMLPLLGIGLGIMALGVGAARAKIRAVEVVRG